jgi:TonB family protein
MKIPLRTFCASGLLACASLCSRLPAQEVIVGEAIWNHGDAQPDEMPRGKLRPGYPRELRSIDEIGYVIVHRYIDAKGEGRNLHATGTQVAFQRAVEEEFSDWNMKPAKRNGQPVDGSIWLSVIFNPATSSEKHPDSTPRLLSVTPVRVPHRPTAKDAPPIVRVKATIDETGLIVQAVPQAELKNDVVEAISASLKEWKFAPARHGGKPVAVELVIPVICEPAPAANVAQRVPPKMIKREEPEYPYAMRRFRLEGRVAIDFEVDLTGKAVNPVIAQSSNPAFDEPAIEALLASKFEPARVDGKPVKARLRQEVHFRMYEGGSDAFDIRGGDQAKLPEEWRFDTAPKIRSVQLPIYPHALRTEGVRGTARVTMAIDERGRVVAVSAVSADRPEFGQALVAAAETFQFDPALRGGKPVKNLLTFEQKFNSRDLGDEAGDWLASDEKKHPEKIASAAALDHPLKPISRRSPVFPVTLPETVTSGEAQVECLVDKKGRVRLPRVVTATDPAFGYAAVQALSTWWFEPPMIHGDEVVVRVRVPFEFKLTAK